jgi:hypothetical protein
MSDYISLRELSRYGAGLLAGFTVAGLLFGEDLTAALLFALAAAGGAVILIVAVAAFRVWMRPG